MEFVDGRTLAAEVTAAGRLPWARAAEIAAKIVGALAAAQAAVRGADADRGGHRDPRQRAAGARARRAADLADRPAAGQGPGRAASPDGSAVLRASAKPTPKPSPIGDACLVGTWRDHGYHTTTTYNGVTVQMTGGSGNVDHITASGTETDVYGSDALPFYGTYNGSTLEEELLDEDVSSLRANPRNHQITRVDHGWTVSSSAKRRSTVHGPEADER